MEASDSDNFDDWEILNFDSAEDENQEKLLQTESVPSLTGDEDVDLHLEIENESPREENESSIDDDNVSQTSEFADNDIYQSLEIDDHDYNQRSEFDDHYYNQRSEIANDDVNQISQYELNNYTPNCNSNAEEALLEVNNSDQSITEYPLTCPSGCNCMSKVVKSIILVLIILILALMAAYWLSELCEREQLIEGKDEHFDCGRPQVPKTERWEDKNERVSVCDCIFKEDAESENVY